MNYSNPFVAPDITPKLRVISLGAGVQSTTMALMAARSEIGPMPDAAIFADTGAEPNPVYEHLRWLTDALPFPVHVVSGGDLRGDVVNGSNTSGGRFQAVPFYLRNLNGDQAMGRRQCTREYKLRPLAQEQRRLLGGARPKRNAVEVWIGISTDEIGRVKPARVQWQRNRWPLIEHGLSRRDCLRWLEINGYPEPPRSACTFCPYRSNREWRDLRDNDPSGWEDAIRVDEAIRRSANGRGAPFVHRSLVPLAQADIEDDADPRQLDLWDNECEGMCGV